MAEENVNLVRKLYDAWERGEFWTHAELYSPDIRTRRIMSSDLEGTGLGGEWEGVEGLIAGFRQWLETWDDLSVEAEEFLDAGEKVVVLTHERGRAKGSGVPLDLKSTSVFEIRDGKVIALDFYWDRSEALKAAGLQE